MADTGAPHQIPYLTPADPPSLHGITNQMAFKLSDRLGHVGRSFVTTSQATGSTSYVLLGTPDRVQNVVVPTNAILQVRYLAMWNISGGGGVTANAAIFVGGTQIAATKNVGTTDRSVAVNATSSGDKWLSTWQHGLVGDSSAGGSADPPAPSSLGQVLGVGLTDGGGGACEIVGLGGTVDVEVRFKITSGTLTVKQRKLWVRVLPF